MSLDFELLENIYSELIEKIDSKAISKVNDQDLLVIFTSFVNQYCQSNHVALSEEAHRDYATHLLHDFRGLGPIQILLDDPEVEEIIVNGYEKIYVERKGRIELTPLSFRSYQQAINVAQKIAYQANRRIDEASPMVNARLADGSRVNIVIQPITLNGITINIRKFSVIPFTLDTLKAMNFIDERVANFVRLCVKARINILISGGTSSGKTTMMNILAQEIPHGERIITIEDSAELDLRLPHWVRLESREANIEGKGAVTIQDLVINCLRMRPDRIIIGEVRGSEAFEMLKAFNTGHEGSFSTIHANSAIFSFLRLENIVSTYHHSIPSLTIKEQIVSAFQLVIHMRRTLDGQRIIQEIVGLTGMKDGEIQTEQICNFVVSDKASDKLEGEYQMLNRLPKLAEKIIDRSIVMEMKKSFGAA